MKIKFFLALAFIIVTSTVFGQQSLNNYKYVIVPKKYDFLKYEDQYQLNSLTKFLFKKEGFETLLDTDTKPSDLANSPCLALIANVKNNSRMLTTKVIIELKNCKNEIVFTSVEGRSKEKEYKKSFQKALRNAFQSITALNYTYKPSLRVTKTEVIKDEELVAVIESVAEEPSDVKKESIAVEVNAPKATNNTEKVSNIDIDSNLLYAQENTLGFQLVDSTPKVMYVLLKSSNDELFFLKNKKGILYKKNGQWIVEYYDVDKLIKKALTIKF